MLNIDPKNIDSAKVILRQGKGGEFWKLIEGALDESIAHLQLEQDDDEIKGLPAEQYKLESELLKAKRKYLRHLKDLPDLLISFLSEPPDNDTRRNFDPYYKPEELAKLQDF